MLCVLIIEFKQTDEKRYLTARYTASANSWNRAIENTVGIFDSGIFYCMVMS